MKEKLWFLKDCDLFERLSPADKRRLESRAVLRTFAAGAFIYFPTDRSMAIVKKLAAGHPEGPIFRNRRGNSWTATR